MTAVGRERELRDYIRSWMQGIGPEIGFWSTWMRTRGMRWPEDYQRRTRAEPDFILEQYLDDRWPLRVLDVGSGPLSPVGLVSSRGPVELHACDPLAHFYAALYLEHGLEPYVRPAFAFAEALTDRFAHGSFDVVHMSNALDHSFLPAAGILSMLAVARPGGTVILRHSENEAEFENYKGFHQWNITERDGDMIVWRQGESVNVSVLVGEYASVRAWRVTESESIPQVIVAQLERNATPMATTNLYKNLFDGELLMELHALLQRAPAAGAVP